MFTEERALISGAPPPVNCSHLKSYESNWARVGSSWGGVDCLFRVRAACDIVRVGIQPSTGVVESVDCARSRLAVGRFLATGLGQETINMTGLEASSHLRCLTLSHTH